MNTQLKSVLVPCKSMLPDPTVSPEVGGDTLHVETVLVCQLNGLLLVMTLVYVPHAGQVLQDRLGGQIVFVLFFSFLRPL